MSSSEKALLSQSTSVVLAVLQTTFRLRICLANKTNFLFCMGMRLSLPARAYFYGNGEKGKHKSGVEKNLFERESELGVLRNLEPTKIIAVFGL